MTVYRCYFRARTGHILALEVIRCGSDDEAMRSAATLIREGPDCHALELWDLGRPVARLTGDSCRAQPLQAGAR